MLSRRALLGTLAMAGGSRAAGTEPRPLLDYFIREIGEADRKRSARLAAISTREELTQLQAFVRSFLTNAIGGFPDRTPLNPRVTGELARPDYVIEKIVFESRPQFFVTANLYRPRTGGRRAGVVHLCGHYKEGKATPDYQRACIGLVKKGFVVLSIDPIGQGERLMYVGLTETGTAEHNVAGRPCHLLGKTLAQFRVWDAMRALDLIESRPEVDGSRLGLFGHSGGGMMTLLTAPIEPRVKAAMSSCAVTSFFHKFGNMMNPDAEQVVPGALAASLDHPELIAAVAPRAFLLGVALKDNVPLAGARRTFDELRRPFAIAGVPDNIGKAETDDVHKMNQELREACCRWMQLHLNGEKGGGAEPEMQVASEQELWCTPDGSAMRLPKARAIFDIHRDEARAMPRPRGRIEAGAVRRLLALPEGEPTPARIVSENGGRLEMETEPGVRLWAERIAAADASSHVIVLSTSGNPTRLKALAGVRSSLAEVALRGWQERDAVAPIRGRFNAEDFYAHRAFELGRPMLGMRVLDVLRTARLLSGGKKLYLAGIGPAGVVALHAAALDPSIAGVALVNSIATWREIFEQPVTSEPVSSFVPGALRHYDLPDLEALIAPRRVRRLRGEGREDALLRQAVEELVKS